MQKIDVENIMQKIETRVEEKMKLTDYEKDVRMIEQLSSKTIEDENMMDLIYQFNAARKLTIPSSTKNGFFADFTNQFLVKIYYVVKKILDGFLIIQSKINSTLIHEVAALKKKVELENIISFPYEEYSKQIRQDEEMMSKTLKVVKHCFQNKDKVLDVGFRNPKLLEYALDQKASKLEAVTGEHTQVSEYKDAGIKVSKTSFLEFFNTCDDESFDMILFVDIAEILDLDLLMANMQHMKRILAKDGVLIVQALDPESTSYNSLALDPRIKKPMHARLMKFVLEKTKFSKIEKINTDIYKNQEKYVFCATK